MLRAISISIVAVATIVASQASAGGPGRGGFYDDIYRDGGCWYAGYYQCGFRTTYTAAPFKRNFAVWRGCFRTERVATERGYRYEKVFVCPPIQ